MKKDLLALIDRIDEISESFHIVNSQYFPDYNKISDIEDFVLWKANVQCELEIICETVKNNFIQDTLEIVKQGFDGWNDYSSFLKLKGALLSIKKNIESFYPSEKTSIPEKVLTPETQVKPLKIFISHSSKDEKYVKLIVDLLENMGVPAEKIFCSSIPGYDIPIDHTIFDELKDLFANYSLHVLFIHSANYYKSAVSLNEMGAAWILKTNYTSILLPGFSYNQMAGIVNNRDISIKLDNPTIMEVKDKLNQLKDKLALELGFIATSGVIWEGKRDKFITEINQIPLQEEKSQIEDTNSSSKTQPELNLDIATDDERIILYYILKMQVRKVESKALLTWINDNEIYDFNIDNGFDLLSTFDGGSIEDGTLIFSLSLFRNYSANRQRLISAIEPCIKQHTKYASETFRNLWYDNKFDNCLMLFIAYIAEERISTFGARWMSEGQIKHIQQWETKNELCSTLSNNYEACLEFFIQNDLVYASSWTSYDNPREYTMCKSLQKLLLSGSSPYQSDAEKVKEQFVVALPF